MKCKFDERIIHLYADGELGETARARAEQHLSICDSCRAKYDAILAIRGKLQSSCASERAPGYLATRILTNIDSIAEEDDVKIGFFDRIRLLIMNLKTTRAVALGMAFGLVMLMVLFPSEQGLSHIAGDLAKEYVGYAHKTSTLPVDMNNHSEVESYFHEQLGIKTRIPAVLASEFELTGACIVQIDNISTAHVRYTNDKVECSLFIFHDPKPNRGSKYTLSAAGKEFEISSASDVNLVCWHEGQIAYVLCGCCCFDKLTQLAASGV